MCVCEREREREREAMYNKRIAFLPSPPSGAFLGREKFDDGEIYNYSIHNNTRAISDEQMDDVCISC